MNIVLIGRLDDRLGVGLPSVLAGQRGENSPGTYLRPDQTIEDAARRELGERTGIYTREFHLVGVFSDQDATRTSERFPSLWLAQPIATEES